jgi:hypothetical protein
MIPAHGPPQRCTREDGARQPGNTRDATPNRVPVSGYALALRLTDVRICR